MHASSILALVFGAAAVAGAAGCGNVLVVPASTGGGSTLSGPTAGSGTGAGGSACAAPLSTCGASCVDLTSDAAHCGACGHDCEGGACVGSVCQPVTLVTTNGYAYGIAVDDTYVYWTESAGNQVMKVPLGGGNPVQIATGDTPTAIAVNATDLYWTDAFSGKVITMPKAGGQPAVLAADQPQLGNLAILDGYAYWLNTGEYTWMSELNRAPLAGGPAVTLATGKPLWGLTAAGVAVDGSNVYSPLAGGPAVTLATGKPLWGLTAAGVAVDGSNVYWASNTGVQSVPVGGGSMVDVGPGSAVTVDATFIYTCNLQEGVTKTPKAGGPGTMIVSGEAECEGPLLVDGTSAYWMVTLPTDTSTIAYVKTTSLSGGPVTVLAKVDDAKFVDLTQDATTLYWTSGGTVMKVRKP